MPARDLSVLLDQIHERLKYHTLSRGSIAGLNLAIPDIRLDTINHDTHRLT